MILRLLCSFLLLLGTTASARQPEAQTAPRPVATAEVHPALWRIADEDTTIYLLGTIHLLPAGLDWFKGPLAQAFDGSDELVTEIPEIDPTQAFGVMVKYAFLPQGQSLRAQLAPKERAKLEAALQKLGLKSDAMDRYRAWSAANELVARTLARYSVKTGVEATLAERAKAAGRPRSGLETLEYQISVLAGFPAAVERRYLIEVIDALPELEQEIDEIVAAWRVGDAAKLAELTNAEQDDPAMVEALFTTRNKAWAQWIKRRLDRPGKVFIAVGAGHLGGAGSVQDQLKAQGVTVSRVQ